jgi:hypothetical protein
MLPHPEHGVTGCSCKAVTSHKCPFRFRSLFFYLPLTVDGLDVVNAFLCCPGSWTSLGDHVLSLSLLIPPIDNSCIQKAKNSYKLLKKIDMNQNKVLKMYFKSEFN